MRFLFESDLHFTEEKTLNKIPVRGIDVANWCEHNKSEKPISAIICIGDLTDHGYDGKYLNFGCFKWYYGGKTNQLGKFISDYVEPIEKTNIPLYCCIGNHDTYVPRPYLHHGVNEYIENKYGSLYYSFDLGSLETNDQLHFVCLSVYPDDDGISFLKKDLKNYPQKKRIIYFHYNLEGPFSNFWSKKDKQRFFKVIEPFRSTIVALLVGHYHIHDDDRDGWENFRIVMAADQQLAVCDYDHQHGLEVHFVNPKEI